MELGKTLYTINRRQWRSWLTKNHNREKEIWLVYPKKSSGKKRISYNDAVEEALCFGWIDSTVKSLDENNSVQRFTPRNPKSGYSQLNKERMKWLLENNLLHPSQLEKAKEIAAEKFVFPKDVVDNIKKDKTVWKNYKMFSDTYKRIRIAYIDYARERPEEFKKRLNNFINKTRANKQIGFGGIEKYY